MKIIQTDSAPQAVGPYSQAIEANGFIFCAGQIGLDPVQKKLVEGLKGQTHQIMKNIQSVLSAADSDLSKVVKTTIFLTDMADYAQVNEIYGSYFASNKPARSTVCVSVLPAGARLEIECIATP